MASPSQEPAARSRSPLVLRHLRFGWCALLLFLTLGIGLDAMHGLKVGWYLDVGSETRRLMLTLAHTHGTLLSLVNLGFAFTLRVLIDPDRSALASRCLIAATLVMPVGFLLGGLGAHAGDPSLGVLLVPAGAALLFAALFLTAREALRASGSPRG